MQLHRSAEKERDKILKELGNKLLNPVAVGNRDNKFKTVADDDRAEQEPGERDGRVAGIL